MCALQFFFFLYHPLLLRPLIIASLVFFLSHRERFRKKIHKLNTSEKKRDTNISFNDFFLKTQIFF